MSVYINSALLTINLIPGILLKPFLKCKLPGTTHALLIWTSFTFQCIKSVNLCLVFLNCKCRTKIICRETYYTKGNPLISTEITKNNCNNEINVTILVAAGKFGLKLFWDCIQVCLKGSLQRKIKNCTTINAPILCSVWNLELKKGFASLGDFSP